MSTFSIFPIRPKKDRSRITADVMPLLTFLFITLCLFCLSATTLAQTQLGAEIPGEAAGVSSIYYVSLSSDGNRLAIGARYNDGNGTKSGHARVYDWSGTTWSQLGEDINGEAAYDYFGTSVSLSASGGRLAVGSDSNDDNGDKSGHVRVYDWSGSAWEQVGTDIDGEAIKDWSGISVSLSSDGNRVAIGAPGNDGNGDGSGHTRVYQWSGTAWTQMGADIDGEAEGDGSGGSVSLSSDGNRLAIGASLNGDAPIQTRRVQTKQTNSSSESSNPENSGHVRMYQWSDSTWTQLGSDIDGEAAGDWSGGSISLSANGSRVAIGADKNSDNGDESGQVRVYQWSGADWAQIGSDINGEAAGDNSGRTVSLSADGNRVAIGAPRNDSNGELSGHVRIYQWIDGDWSQLGVDIDGKYAGDWSGRSVSLSSDGNRVASGSGLNMKNGNLLGYVRVHDLSMFNVFNINPGLNDAWYYEPTSGQGFFITVFPDLGYVSLAWFTYDTELPPIDAVANLGDPGHRWLTAVGPIDGNQSVMDIEMTSGGIFDTASIIERTDPPGSDGTITLTFDGCNSGTIEYDIPSINRRGLIPIVRVANDNIVICEALK